MGYAAFLGVKHISAICQHMKWGYIQGQTFPDVNFKNGTSFSNNGIFVNNCVIFNGLELAQPAYNHWNKIKLEEIRLEECTDGTDLHSAHIRLATVHKCYHSLPYIYGHTVEDGSLYHFHSVCRLNEGINLDP